MRFDTMSPTSGSGHSDAAVRKIERRGRESLDWWRTSCPLHASFILGQMHVSPLNTQGGSPVRELRTPGSVRGVAAMRIPTAINVVSEVIRSRWA